LDRRDISMRGSGVSGDDSCDRPEVTTVVARDEADSACCLPQGVSDDDVGHCRGDGVKTGLAFSRHAVQEKPLCHCVSSPSRSVVKDMPPTIDISPDAYQGTLVPSFCAGMASVFASRPERWRTVVYSKIVVPFDGEDFSPRSQCGALGSVTMTVVHRAQCPLLVHRPSHLPSTT
jgi:hypothetical protein